MHSALKQDGKPLYEYARAGITRERAARAIVIRELRLLDWQTPDLSFEVRCTKGAYIRVLAEDLAAQLGTIGHLAALRRIGVTPFAEPLFSFETLEAMSHSAAARECCCRWMRRCAPAGGLICPRAGSAHFGRGKPLRWRWSSPEWCVSMRRAWDFWVWAKSRRRAAWCRCDLFRRPRIVLEGRCRDAYNARLLKRSKLLIEV